MGPWEYRGELEDFYPWDHISKLVFVYPPCCGGPFIKHLSKAYFMLRTSRYRDKVPGNGSRCEFESGNCCPTPVWVLVVYMTCDCLFRRQVVVKPTSHEVMLLACGWRSVYVGPAPILGLLRPHSLCISSNLIFLKAQVANTRPVDWIRPSALFYLAQHLVSTWRQCQALAKLLQS